MKRLIENNYQLKADLLLIVSRAVVKQLEQTIELQDEEGISSVLHFCAEFLPLVGEGFDSSCETGFFK